MVYHAMAGMQKKTDKMPALCKNGKVKTFDVFTANQNSWHKCKFQRNDIINITKNGFDVNGDGFIEMWECEKARNFYFKPAELAWGESCQVVMNNCDCDGDGKISHDDFIKSYMHCVESCAKAEQVDFFLGRRIVNGTAYTTGKNEVSDDEMPDSLKQIKAKYEADNKKK
jgi:hypothetical protein